MGHPITLAIAVGVGLAAAVYTIFFQNRNREILPQSAIPRVQPGPL